MTILVFEDAPLHICCPKTPMRRLTKSLEELRNDSVNLSLEIDDKAHNKNILLLLAGCDLFSSFSFLRLDVFCSENKNN